jgi:hypothetical protein
MVRAFPRCSRCECPVNRDECVQVRARRWHPRCWDAYQLEVLAEAMKDLAR